MSLSITLTREGWNEAVHTLANISTLCWHRHCWVAKEILRQHPDVYEVLVDNDRVVCYRQPEYYGDLNERTVYDPDLLCREAIETFDTVNPPNNRTQPYGDPRPLFGQTVTLK